MCIEIISYERTEVFKIFTAKRFGFWLLVLITLEKLKVDTKMFCFKILNTCSLVTVIKYMVLLVLNYIFPGPRANLSEVWCDDAFKKTVVVCHT